MTAGNDRPEPELVTFGCRLNTYESEVMRDLSRDCLGDDAVIVNTCAVTAEAERQARQAIRRLRRDRPDARIIVTGCAAQISPDAYRAMPDVDAVVGNDAKLRPETWRALSEGRDVVLEDIMQVRETANHLVEGFDGRARAFVQVQNGCDHRCTFCIIPYGRGPNRSTPMGALVSQVRSLVERGYREVVLTGVDITAYGDDLPGQPSLGQLARRLLAQVPDLPRLRLSSIDVAEVDDALLRLIAEEPRLMPHLHLSLQAGDDLILKRMKRRHLRADAVAFCDQVRRMRPDVAFGADLIAGFPTEDEAAFRNTLALIEDCDLAHLHVFPFSAREGAPAARMPQVDKATRKQRAARLRAEGDRARRSFLLREVGRTANVLVERTQDGAATGYTEKFAPMRFSAEGGDLAGRIVPVRATATANDGLVGIAA